MVATTDKLSTVHGLLADTMSEALDAEKQRIALTRDLMNIDPADMDEDTAKAVSGILTLAPTARVDNGLLKTIAGFLKDNNITSDLDAEGEADEKLEKLKALKAKRTIAKTPVDLMN